MSLVSCFDSMCVMSCPPLGTLSVIAAECIVGERHHVEPPASRVKQGLRQRRSNRRQNNFAEALRGTVAGEPDRADFRPLVEGHKRLGGKIARPPRAVPAGDPDFE